MSRLVRVQFDIHATASLQGMRLRTDVPGPDLTSAEICVAAAQFPRSGQLNVHRIYAPFPLPKLLGFSGVEKAMTYAPQLIAITQ